MKQIILLGLVFLMACSTPEFKPKKLPKETPKALQKETSDISSMRGRSNNDLVEELYQGLVDETPGLKLINKEMSDIRANKNNLNNEFSNYDYKSKTYYDAASGKLSTVSDSTLKLKLSNLIKESLVKYNAKTGSVQSLLKLMDRKSLSISDYHIALMVIKTLPLIEKYQEDNLPDSKAFKDLLKQQSALLKKMDSLIIQK